MRMVYLEALRTEFRAIFKYKGLIIILFIAPVFLTFLFGGVYVNDYVKDIPIALLDEDGTSLSHLVGNYFETNERFDVVCFPTSNKEMQRLLDEGQIHLGLVIPKDFERNVTTYESSEILVLLDGSNIVVSGNAYAQASQIIQTISAGIEMKLIQGKSVSPQMAEHIALVYNVSERILYDDKMTYMNYLMLCFLAVFVQQMILSAIGSLFNRDSDYLLKGNTFQKILGTSSACFIAIIPSTVISLLVITKLFHVSIVGNLGVALLMTILFVLALTGPALIIAAMTKDRVKYSQISFMLSLPTFVASGCIWPTDQMPKALELLIRVLWPLINYAKPVQELLIKGMDFGAVLPNILQLCLFSLIWLPIGITLYKRELAVEGSLE